MPFVFYLHRRMKSIIAIILLLVGNTCFSQFTLTGFVKDAETKNPVNNASVFITNSRIGMSTGTDGSFTLQIPQGKYEVIFSSVGYETQVISVDDKSAREMTVSLKLKQKELEGVTVVSYERDGWKKYGQFFSDNFIGTVTNASACVLKNPETIRFRKSKKDNTLTAIAFDPIIIENKALGYTLKYQLENFLYNYNTQIFYYEGYPLFTEMEGTEAQKQQWEANRKKVYYGSVLHFMRSLYQNRLSEEGFDIRQLAREENHTRQKIKAILDERKARRDSGQTVPALPPDTLRHYNLVMQQPEINEIVSADPLPSDSFTYRIDSATAGFDFTGLLQVTYKNAKPEQAYVAVHKNATAQVSQLKITDEYEIMVFRNGVYYPAKSLLSSGYWAWSEKAGNMLPIDYEPVKTP